jgi:hypothetical protein
LVRNLRLGFRIIGAVGLLVLIGSWVRRPSAQAEPSRTATWVTAHTLALRVATLAVAVVALLLLNQPAVASVVLVLVLAAAAFAVIEYLARSGRRTGAPASTG